MTDIGIYKPPINQDIETHCHSFLHCENYAGLFWNAFSGHNLIFKFSSRQPLSYNLQLYLKTFLSATNFVLIQKWIRIFDSFSIYALMIAIIDFKNFSFQMEINLVDLDILLTLLMVKKRCAECTAWPYCTECIYFARLVDTCV